MHNETILIVEDNVYNLDMARDLLKRVGFQVIEAYDADRGIQMAKHHDPDLILMDMHLPSITGYEASRLIKSDPQTRHIPIVGFTALAMDDEKQMAFNSGCIGLICKPIDVDTFAQTVSVYLHNGRQEADQNIMLYADTASSSSQRRMDDHQKKQLFMEFSHDTQASIRKINQFVSMLRQSNRLGPEEYEFLDGIERSSLQMQGVLSKTLITLRQSGLG